MGTLTQRMMGFCPDSPELWDEMNVDIVFAIDATMSMQPLLDKVKELTLSFRSRLEEGLRENRRVIHHLRVKVIVFRDYYVDDRYAMEQSPFFYLPEQDGAFHDYVSAIRAGGGGDEPENGLEALDLALHSDFTREGSKRRHVIVVFTDASAHPFEKAQFGTPDHYPASMCRNMRELYALWGSRQSSLGSDLPGRIMDNRAKRLVLFAPELEPWTDLARDIPNTIRRDLKKGNGGRDLDLKDVITLIANSLTNG